MKRRIFIFTWVLGCSGSTATLGSSADPVLARVNGVAITRGDVEYRLRTDAHQNTLRPEFEKNILEAVVRDEILAKRAVELGLDADPEYQRGARAIEIQLNAYKRKRLAELLLRKEIDAKVKPTDDEARAYYDSHLADLQREIRVFQILKMSENDIRQAQQSLQGGQSFEEVARAGFSMLPDAAASAPWDLGYQRWQQLPAPWREALNTLQPGQVSAILRGPKHRFWLLKLIDRRDNPSISFETEKAPLLEMLANDRREQIREQTETALRQQARIEYFPAPLTAFQQAGQEEAEQ